MAFASAEELRTRLEGVARVDGDRLEVTDAGRFRDELVDELAFEAVFNADEALRDAARWVIWAASLALGCGSSSIHELYMARGRGEIEPTRFTVPAINVRASAYLTARQAFAAALERDAGAVVLEIAKSEMAYTEQRPAEYTAVILAAAIREGWRTPVFLQGDHFQFNAAKWSADPTTELDGIMDLTREAIAGGFMNIDIDSSTLVDLDQPTELEQQRVNAENTAELTRLIRQLEPAGVTISIGGVPLPDGTVAEAKIDFDTLRRLSAVAREEYGLAGCVQHGASTLPEEAFGRFPAAGTAEIHLATGFQNILYDGGGLPDDLRDEMMAWCVANCADERKQGETDEQFLYKTRKKALGPFKRQLWSLPQAVQSQIGEKLRARFGLLFDALGVANTRELVERHVRPVAIGRPLPAALGGGERAAVAAGASVFEDDGSGE